jgi:hypothetical protein
VCSVQIIFCCEIGYRLAVLHCTHIPCFNRLGLASLGHSLRPSFLPWGASAPSDRPNKSAQGLPQVGHSAFLKKAPKRVENLYPFPGRPDGQFKGDLLADLSGDYAGGLPPPPQRSTKFKCVYGVQAIAGSLASDVLTVAHTYQVGLA